MIDDGKHRKEPKHLSEYWTDRGIEFIEQSRQETPDKPFFLFLAYNGSYSLSSAMKEAVPSPWSDPYVDHALPMSDGIELATISFCQETGGGSRQEFDCSTQDRGA